MPERSCVIVVENLPVPFDRRVWQEALALRKAGWQVSVICPASPRHPQEFEWLNGIAIYRHPLPLEARRKFAFFIEFGIALFHELRLLIKVWRQRGFYIVQACNPPDLIFLVALPFKLLGKRFIFDHHDANPELFEAKFKQKGAIYRLLLLFERLTFLTADLVVSANQTYRDIAITRGGKRPEQVVTVYSVPDKSRLRRVDADRTVRHGKRFVLGYVGIIGDQDGVDHMVLAVEHLLRRENFTDFHAVIVGDGTALGSARKLAEDHGLNDHITFTGYLSGDALLKHLSTFDIGIIPDPVNPFNDTISMNKVFEYSALGIPSVSYPLTETRRLLGDAAVYAEGNTPEHLAAACFKLMSDERLRMRCVDAGLALAKHSFSWEDEAKKYVAAYECLIAADTKLRFA
jgi:glycosyltransferase involved in cell wall biosynthesis